MLRKFLFKLFYPQIIAVAKSMAEDMIGDLEIKREQKKTYANYPIGQKVIVRSNEPDDLLIGEVSGYSLHENSQKVFLTIKDKAGTIYHIFDRSPAYWTKERESALRKLNWAEQWNVMSKYYDIDEEHQKYKESPEYKNR